VPLTLLFSITGIWYFLERANIGGIGRDVNPRPPKVLDVPENSSKKQDLNYTVDYDKAIAIAEKEIPGLTVGNILPPQNDADDFYLIGKSDVPLVRQRANRVYLNPHSYEVIASQKATEINTKIWLNDIADPLHFGYWGGLVTKIIWFIFGLGISSLVGGGIWITVKRKAIKRKQSNQKIMGVWRFLNWGVYAIMLFFMYYILFDRYDISTTAFSVITAGWLLFTFGCYYIFVFKIKRSVEKALNRKT
jgi:hypothetical protein